MRASARRSVGAIARPAAVADVAITRPAATARAVKRMSDDTSHRRTNLSTTEDTGDTGKNLRSSSFPPCPPWWSSSGLQSRRMAETQYRLVPPPTPDDDAREARMGFLEHLDELRRRLIRACIAIAAGMVVAFAFYDRIADFVLAPTLRTLPPNTALVFTI